MNFLFELLAILVSLGGLPAVFAMGWRPCGCKCCYLDVTEFGGSKPSDWTEVSGTWTYGSGYATTEDSSAILINDNSITPTKYKIFAVVQSSTTGDEVRVIFNYLDSSNYHYAQITIGSSGGISLVKVTSGTPSTLSSESNSNFPVGEDIYVTICVNVTYVGAQTHEIDGGGGTHIQNVQYDSYSAHASGDQAGVGTGATSSVPPDDPSSSFGDFRIDETQPSKDVCPVCGECGKYAYGAYRNFCCNDGAPDTVDVTLTDDWTEGDATDCDLSGTYTLARGDTVPDNCVGSAQQLSSCSYGYIDLTFTTDGDGDDVALRIDAWVTVNVSGECFWQAKVTITMTESIRIARLSNGITLARLARINLVMGCLLACRL